MKMIKYCPLAGSYECVDDCIFAINKHAIPQDENIQNCRLAFVVQQLDERLDDELREKQGTK